MKSDLFWIPGPWSGRLAIAGRPRGGDWLADEVAAWRQAGIVLVVSFLEDDEVEQLGLMDERRAVETQGLDFFSFPIPDRDIPRSIPLAVSAIGIIATQLDQGKNVAMHCRQSVGRSGLIAVALLMNSGIQGEQAIRIVSSARGLEVPETREQLSWLDQLSLPTAVAS